MTLRVGRAGAARKWTAITMAVLLLGLAAAALAASSRGASFLPEVTGRGSDSSSAMLAVLGVSAVVGTPFVLAGVSGRRKWGAVALVALAVSLASMMFLDRLPWPGFGRASLVAGAGLGVMASIALDHESRRQLAGRCAVLVAYVGLAAALGEALNAAAALLVLPAIGAADALTRATEPRPAE